MKVSMNKEFKKHFTLDDLERAKAVMQYEKEDEETVAGWAEYAAREALKDSGEYATECISAKAETAKNRRAWDAYGEGTEDMDVWIEALFITSFGMMKIGAYLSDIWQTGAAEYKYHMYIEYYKRTETI